MLLRDQRGLIDSILYSLAALSIIAFCFLLVLTLTSSDEQARTETSTVREGTPQSETVITSTPNDWHSYTNPQNDFSFLYPKEWGVIEQSVDSGSSIDADSYTYRFTSKPNTVMTQRNARSDEPTHNNTFLMYNSFRVVGTDVIFCATIACRNSTQLATDAVRLFTTTTMFEAAEVVAIDGSNLQLTHIVANQFVDWPGVAISTTLSTTADATAPIDEEFDAAESANYEETQLLRQFADLIP